MVGGPGAGVRALEEKALGSGLGENVRRERRSAHRIQDRRRQDGSQLTVTRR